METEPPSCVYDAAIIMAKFLQAKELQGKCLLELGAGCGFTGLYLASSRGLKHAILTDVASVVDLIQENIEVNNLTNASAIQLFWGNQTHLDKVISRWPHIDIVVGADVVFDFENFEGMMELLC